MKATERISEHPTEGTAADISANTEAVNSNKIIHTGISCRDPFILVDNGVYYMYTTLWNCYKNTTGNLETGWKEIPCPVVFPEDGLNRELGDPCPWAPEVYKYNGAYYMITTYISNTTKLRGCTILKADSPEGPFEEISNGHITQKDGERYIDGTLYVDPQGQPWLVYVGELHNSQRADGVGSMWCAKLSKDLTKLISKPVELFLADEPAWSWKTGDWKRKVTDGCFMYTTKNNSLLMIWSTFIDDGQEYIVAIARSESGLITGPWTHDNTFLYSKSVGFAKDGGHGMLFTDTNGKMYLALHSPNNTSSGASKESPEAIFVPIVEKDNTLVCCQN